MTGNITDIDFDSLVTLRLMTHNTRLLAARKAKGWTQKEACRMLGRQSMWLSPIETLKRAPNSEEQAAIAELYGDIPSYLFPPTLMQAITAGVFEKRVAQLDEPQVAALTVSQYQRLTYDGETEMIEELERGLLGERLGEILSTLPERMRRVIEMRFGLGQREGKGPRFLRQIAQELDLSTERIRQIESKALEEMRHPDHSRELRDFLDDPAVIEGAPADKQ